MIWLLALNHEAEPCFAEQTIVRISIAESVRTNVFILSMLRLELRRCKLLLEDIFFLREKVDLGSMSRHMRTFLKFGLLCWLSSGLAFAEVKLEDGLGTLKFSGGEGPGRGQHVVLLAGDEEYRSEEVMPLLARILTEQHGFDTTVLFSADEDGTINPNAQKSLMGPEALDSADAIVMLLRFRGWNDATMTKFKNAVDRGIPVIALRTSTHVFKFPKDSKWAEWAWNHESGGFGRTVIGETWISHWGHHGHEGTLTKIEVGQESNPILNGVGEVFGDSDVYEVYPPEDATILLRGYVLSGMDPKGKLADHDKKRKSDKLTQKVNAPAMPVAWSREIENEAGTKNKVVTTTMGAVTDLADEDLRRFVVNAVYWGLEMEVPEKADVPVPDDFKPTKFGFEAYQKNMKAIDFSK